MSQIILITGASGRTSGLIVQEFIQQETRVRALVRDIETVPALRPHPYVELVEGRLGDATTLGPALEGVDRALLISSPRGPMLRDQCAFIDAAKAAGVRHVVKFSGRETGLDFLAQNFWATRDHETIEAYLEASGLLWTQLRPSQFMQIYLDELPSIKKHRRLLRPMDDARVSPVDLHDVAQVAYRVLTEAGHEGRRYELTGPEALSMADVAAYISEATGREIPYVNITPDEFVTAMKAEGAPPPVIEVLSQIYGERRKSRYSSVNLDTYRQFGMRPTSFREFAHPNADWWRPEA
jgi:uncharacterized protein YbjT (DUF2867 family)